jgi:hypothetical protein
MLGDCCCRTRNDRCTGLFIRKAGQIFDKNPRYTRRRTISSKLDAKAHRRAGPQGGVYERLTLREQKIADIETAKFIEEGKDSTAPISSEARLGSAATFATRTRPTPIENLPEVPDPAAARGPAARHYQLVHQKPGQRPAAQPRRSRLRTLEAHIISQRNGTALADGKH